jgi:hypothetical protein
MEEIYITEQFDIDDIINRLNELTYFYCQMYSFNEEDSQQLRNVILRAITLALAQYMSEDLHENFIFYVGSYVKIAVSDFRANNKL